MQKSRVAAPRRLGGENPLWFSGLQALYYIDKPAREIWLLPLLHPRQRRSGHAVTGSFVRPQTHTLRGFDGDIIAACRPDETLEHTLYMPVRLVSSAAFDGPNSTAFS